MASSFPLVFSANLLSAFAALSLSNTENYRIIPTNVASTSVSSDISNSTSTAKTTSYFSNTTISTMDTAFAVLDGNINIFVSATANGMTSSVLSSNDVTSNVASTSDIFSSQPQNTTFSNSNKTTAIVTNNMSINNEIMTTAMESFATTSKDTPKIGSTTNDLNYTTTASASITPTDQISAETSQTNVSTVSSTIAAYLYEPNTSAKYKMIDKYTTFGYRYFVIGLTLNTSEWVQTLSTFCECKRRCEVQHECKAVTYIAKLSSNNCFGTSHSYWKVGLNYSDSVTMIKTDKKESVSKGPTGIYYTAVREMFSQSLARKFCEGLPNRRLIVVKTKEELDTLKDLCSIYDMDRVWVDGEVTTMSTLMWQGNIPYEDTDLNNLITVTAQELHDGQTFVKNKTFSSSHSNYNYYFVCQTEDQNIFW